MAQIDLGSLFIKIGANTEALNGLPGVLKSLENSISKLESSVSSLNTTMSKSYQGIANSAMKSAEAVKKAEEAKVSSIEKTGVALFKKQQQIEKLWESKNKSNTKQPSMEDIWGAREKDLISQKTSDMNRGFKAIESIKKEEIAISRAANTAAKSEIAEYESALDTQIQKEKEVSNALALKIQKMDEANSKFRESIYNLTRPLSSVSGQAEKSAKVFQEYYAVLEQDQAINAAIANNKRLTKEMDKVAYSAKESMQFWNEYESDHEEALKMDKTFDAKRKGGFGKYSMFALGGKSSRLSEETSRTRNLGFAVQNTSYQLQDMIVQLEMGTDVARVMGQQLPQLFSGFGVLGSVIGFAAAALAVIIPSILTSGDSAEEASKNVDKYTEALSKGKSIAEDFEESQAKLNGTISEFSLKDFRHEIDRISSNLFSTDLWSVITRGFNEDKLIKIIDTLHKAQIELADTQKNNEKLGIIATSTTLNQVAAYNKGIISLKEYGIQKKLTEEINSKGLQGNAEAIRLAEIQIRLQEELASAENYMKIAREVEDLDIALSQANQTLNITSKLGTNAGERIKQSFSVADQVREYTRELKDAKGNEVEFYAALLNVSTAGLSNEAVINKVANAMANAKTKTTALATATSNLAEIQKTTAGLSDRIAGFKAGGGAFSQMFTPELFTKLSDFEKRTREIQRNLEFKVAGGDTSVITNNINEYSKVAKEAGLTNPFEGIDPNNTRAVAVGIASIERSVEDLDKTATTTISTFDNLAKGIQRAWMEVDTLGQHGEFAAKKLKDSFEVQDIFETVDKSITSWEQLELAVSSAAKEGVDISNVYTYATNSSTALKDSTYGLALALAQVKIKTQEAGDAQTRVWDSSAIVEMNNKLNDVNLQLDVMDKMTLGDKFINLFDTAPLEKMIQKEREAQVGIVALQQEMDNSPTNYEDRIKRTADALYRLNIVGQDLSSPGGIIAAQQVIDEKMKELPFSAKAVVDAVANVAGQAASLFGQLSSMYAEQASYHKQMADQALSYGRDQANLYMDLADAVHYSNNVQAQSFEARAIAAAEAAATQYQAEKKAQAQSNALAKSNFERQKKLQIAQAMMNTAIAVSNVLAHDSLYGGMAVAVPLAIAMGTLGAAQVAMIQSQQYTPRVTGGSALSSRTHIVGESGPEIFVPGRSGTVLSQKTIADSLMEGGNGGSTNVTFNINAIDTQSAAQVIMQNRGMIESIIVQSNNRRMRS